MTDAKRTPRYFWLKLHESFFDDQNIIFLETQTNGEKYIVFWQKLLLRTLRAETPGMLRFTENIPYDDTLLATVTRTDVDTVRVAMALFQKLGMVEILDDKTIYIEAIQKLIGKETDAAERMRRMRDRNQKKLPGPEQSKEEQEIDSYSEKEEEEELESDVTGRNDVTEYAERIKKINGKYPRLAVSLTKSLQETLARIEARGFLDDLFLDMAARGAHDGAGFVARLASGECESDFLALPVCKKCGQRVERVDENDKCQACNFAAWKAREGKPTQKAEGEIF